MIRFPNMVCLVPSMSHFVALLCVKAVYIEVWPTCMANVANVYNFVACLQFMPLC